MQDTAEFRRLTGPVDTLPESPCWHSPTRQVFWIVLGSKSLKLFGFFGFSCEVFDLETDDNIRFVQSLSDCVLLVGSERGLYQFDIETGILSDFGNPPPLSPATCINDGAIGPDGLFAAPKGDLFVSYWGGGAVEVLSPSAELLQRFELASKNATCCCVFQHSGTRYLLVSTAGDTDGSVGVFLRTINEAGYNG